VRFEPHAEDARTEAVDYVYRARNLARTAEDRQRHPCARAEWAISARHTMETAALWALIWLVTEEEDET